MWITWVWSVLLLIGFVFSIRNLINRHKNRLALAAAEIDGEADLVQRLMIRSEIIRMGEVTILLLVGLLSLYMTYYPTSRELVKIISIIFNYGFLTFAVLLVYNIWYTGSIGKRLMKYKEVK